VTQTIRGISSNAESISRFRSVADTLGNEPQELVEIAAA
jgi:hypothetical protein